MYRFYRYYMFSSTGNTIFYYRIAFSNVYICPKRMSVLVCIFSHFLGLPLDTSSCTECCCTECAIVVPPAPMTKT